MVIAISQQRELHSTGAGDDTLDDGTDVGVVSILTDRL
jgi:hypothetical protein